MTAPPENGERGPEFDRAEQMVEQMAQCVSVYASQVGFWVLKSLARGREELEDMWAEAESMSRREQ